ncbi:MAG TPA: radical SAM protein, partial [Longimicrobium sp.]
MTATAPRVLPTLKKRHAPLASAAEQREMLARVPVRAFGEALAGAGLLPLRAAGVEILQLNVGRKCNQTCRHCHVDAGPDRTETMPDAVVDRCLEIIETTDIPTVDITGGAPEMNPHFRWFVDEARRLGRHVIDRCNLTILHAPGFEDLAEFLADRQVEVIASLPCYL